MNAYEPTATLAITVDRARICVAVTASASDTLFFIRPDSVSISALRRQCLHSRYHVEEVLMGKLALFLGGFLLLTLLVGLLGTIPPG
ncbi:MULTISPECIES: hypothetical protein [Pseudomonas]|uniref:hypothetical protein n=1 Tax=Pseudomonas TaxID=286 RepID=UPI002270A46A|nr:hypothetical protein [Pseudomonas putida]WAB96265.1 hypothetical protein OSW16_17080 [Pseudomonas putida]